MRCTLLQTIAAIASYCVATPCMPLRLLHLMELQTIALQAISDHGGYRKLVRALVAMATYCVASYCKPLRLLQAIVLQGIASLGGYDKQSHCKQLQANASHCGYCKLMHGTLLQASAAVAKYRIANYCTLLRLLQANALQAIVLQATCCKPLWPCKLSLVANYANQCGYYQLLRCKLSQVIAKNHKL